MKFVIFGEPQTGKTTFFQLLTGIGEKQKHLAMVHVPDPRLEAVGKVAGSKKKTPISLAFVDPPAREELNEMRGGDALLHVIRAEDPLSIIKEVEEEFVEKDLETVSGRLERLKKDYSRKKDREIEREIAFFEEVKSILEKGRSLRQEMDEVDYLRGLGLLSLKPIIHVINCDFEEVQRWGREMEKVSGRMRGAFALDARTELELINSSEEERRELMEEFGIAELRSEKFLAKAFQVLDLIVFYTPSEKETRAWEVRRGTSALEAAGKVHTDIARGFIRAEVASWEKFVEAGGWSGLKTSGELRLEGRDYTVQDGDVIYFRFNK